MQNLFWKKGSALQKTSVKRRYFRIVIIQIKFQLDNNFSSFGIKRMPTKGALWNPGRQKEFRSCESDLRRCLKNPQFFEKN